MSDRTTGPSLKREVMLRAVPVGIVAASAWWFLDAPDWIWLLPVGVALVVLLGRGLRGLAPSPPPDASDPPGGR